MIFGKKRIKKILIVDDNEFFCNMLAKYFKRYHEISPIICKTISEADNAIECDTKKWIKVALIDVGLADGNGIDFMSGLNKSRPDIDTFIATASDADIVSNVSARKIFFKSQLDIHEVIDTLLSRVKTT